MSAALHTEPAPRRGDAMRSRIVDAAEQVLVEHGARAATTRALARAAGCAEGTLYVHFPDRPAIFSAVFEKRWPPAAAVLDSLADRVGSGDVVENVALALEAIHGFMVALEPLIAAVKSEPAIAGAMQARWCETDQGPHRMVGAIAGYLVGEQRAGRISADVDPLIAAEALIGFLFYILSSSRFMPAGPRSVSPESLRRLIGLNVRPAEA